ncbi:MAG: hypothetical protein IJ225_06520 [Solobacterium sp.]|nr:hypothetical protein [Solobacterium sp.]
MKQLFIVVCRDAADNVNAQIWNNFNSACVAHLQLLTDCTEEAAAEQLSEQNLERISNSLIEDGIFALKNNMRECYMFYIPKNDVSMNFDQAPSPEQE